MKKFSKSLLAILLATILALSFTACGKTTDTTKQYNSSTVEESQTSEKEGVEKSGLWENATYTEDTEFGKGSKEVVVEIKANDQSVKFTIHTDENTVGAALLENDLIAGDEGEYGLYVKVVNGMTADYDVDQSYWAFYIDGEYALTGVDSAEITEGAVYQIVYAK